jgi:hypothetical protein
MLKLPPWCMGLDPKLCARPCAAGIDIRPDSWDVCVLDVVRSQKVAQLRVPRLVFYGKVEDEAQAWHVLCNYGVRFGVADAQPDATLAERLQKRAQKRAMMFWRARYNSAPSEVKVVENALEGMLRLERTMVLDDVQFALAGGLGLALPQNYKLICGGDFAREMVASVRVPEMWHQRLCFKWQNQGPDHAFHAVSYALVALEKGKLLNLGTDATMGAIPGIVDRPASGAGGGETAGVTSVERLTDPFGDEGADDAEGVMQWVAA